MHTHPESVHSKASVFILYVRRAGPAPRAFRKRRVVWGTRHPQESNPPPNPNRQFTIIVIIVDIFIISVFVNFLHQQKIYASHGSYVFNHLQ